MKAKRKPTYNKLDPLKPARVWMLLVQQRCVTEVGEGLHKRSDHPYYPCAPKSIAAETQFLQRL